MTGVDDAVTLGEGDAMTAEAMTTVNVAEADVPAFAVTVTEKVPAAVGVPVIAPVAALIASPPGSPVAVQVGVPVPPVAATAAE